MVTSVDPYWSLQFSAWSGSWDCEQLAVTVPFALWVMVWAPTTRPLASLPHPCILSIHWAFLDLCLPHQDTQALLDPLLTAHKPGDPGDQTLV